MDAAPPHSRTREQTEDSPVTKLRRFKRPPVQFEKTATSDLRMDEGFQLDDI
jgi:hypothetical protein